MITRLLLSALLALQSVGGSSKLGGSDVSGGNGGSPVVLAFVKVVHQNSGVNSVHSINVLITANAGDCLVGFSRFNGAGRTLSITDTGGNGWTQTSNGVQTSDGTDSVAMVYVANANFDSSVTFTWSGLAQTVSVTILEFRGCATSSLQDGAVGTNNGASGTTSTTGTLTTTNAIDALVACTGVGSSFTSPVAGSGFTNASGTINSSSRTMCEYKIVSSTFSGTTTQSWTTANTWATVFAGFK